MNAIKPILKQILTSKKWLAGIAAVVVWALAQAGILATPDQVLPVLSLLGALIIGQGLADIGKESKKVEVAAIEKAMVEASPKPLASPE